MLRRILLAALLVYCLSPALAQAPPPVPALPDTIRVTNYSISGSTCACAVGFQIYGDQTDIDNWITVSVNSVVHSSTDPTFGWSLSSPSGALSAIARPITDAILTFNSPQTGTITIVGAERPRRLSTFAENQGITARQFNQIFNTVFAELRENWDKLAGALFAQPGQTIGLLPPAVNCVNMIFSFGADGKTPTCVNLPGGSSSAIVVGVRSSAAATVTVSPTSDYFLCLDPTSNAIAVNLPASPQTGSTYLVKDCTGKSNLHNITITPAAGNIDGSGTLVMFTNYQSVAVTFTGSQWSAN